MWIPLLIGIGLGAAWALAVIFALCVVETKEKWHEHNHIADGVRHRVYALVAENAQLRIALGAGQMTEEGKKIATMAMTALDAVSTAESQALLKPKPSPA